MNTRKKIAILSDIHSNLTAFKAVMKDVLASGAEEVVFLGDIVGYGSHPAECVKLVRVFGGKCVKGNHDRDAVVCRTPGFKFAQPNWEEDDYAAGLVHSAKQLDEEAAEWLRGLPYWGEIEGAVVAHGSLDEPGEFNYVECEETAEPSLELLGRHHLKVVFLGHTHWQRVFVEGGKELEWPGEGRFRVPAGTACAVTVGAVGQPRHVDDARACWTLWTPELSEVEFRRVEYDREKAAREIVAAGLPRKAAERLFLPWEELPEMGMR